MSSCICHWVACAFNLATCCLGAPWGVVFWGFTSALYPPVKNLGDAKKLCQLSFVVGSYILVLEKPERYLGAF